MATTDVDVVVIGSGPGGLSAAILAAKAGKSVLVLEKHYMAGGYTHAFKRKGFKFDVGIHYIGDVGPGETLGRFLNYLELDELNWVPVRPEGYDRIVGPDLMFDIPAGRENYQRKMEAEFPKEKKAIAAYFDTVLGMGDEMRHLMMIKGPKDVLNLPSNAPTFMKWGWRTLGAFLDAHTQDPRLRTVMAGICGDYGLPPSKAPMPMHAMLVGHYMNGAYYPQGGSGNIPKAMVKALKKFGGEIKTRTGVKRILTEKGRAIGVELEDGTTIRAEHVISNAGAVRTYTKLLNPDELPLYWRVRSKFLKPSAASYCLFMGVQGDPSDLGLGAENWWGYPSHDIDRLYDVNHQWPGGGMGPSYFVSSPSCKDPSSKMAPEGHFTIDVVTLIDWERFRKWKNTVLEQRGEDYEVLKAELKDSLLDAMELRFPSLKERIVHVETSTPLTNLHYGDYPQGAIYGLEKNFLQIPPLGPPVSGPLDGLLLTGADTLGHGFGGALAGGYAAASALLKENLFKASSVAPQRDNIVVAKAS